MVFVASPAIAASPLMAQLDTNKDGSLAIDEIKAAAAAAFERLMNGSPQAMFAHKRATEHLRSKFIALVIKWFTIADLNKDGRLDEDELAASAGRKLGRLLAIAESTLAQPAEPTSQP